MREKCILEDIISDLEMPKEHENIVYDKFIISEEIYQSIAKKIKEETIQETTRALQKSELCENVIDFDLMRAKLELRDINQFLKHFIIQMRNFIYDVNPIEIVHEDVEKSIIQFISYIENQWNMNFSFGRKGTTIKIEDDVIWIIIRFMQCIIEYDSSVDINITLEYLESKISFQVICSKKNDNMKATEIDFNEKKKMVC